jgi:uncharacterized membrane protein YciS (DUF1049 family)
MSIFWLCIGFIIGLFIPGPFNLTIRTVLINLWRKIIGKKTEVNEKSIHKCCDGQ